MRFAFFFICYLLFAPLLRSQDTLYRTNRQVIPVYVIKVDSFNVSYKHAGDAASLIYIIDKAYITKIVYQNGEVESYTQPFRANYVEKGSGLAFVDDNHPNGISINIFDLVFGLVTFEYERIFSSGVFSLRVPLTIGLQWDNSHSETFQDNGYKQRLFRTGCGIYFHPGDEESGKYSIRASIEFGKNRGSEIRWVCSLLLNNGFYFMISRNFFMSLNAGIGLGTIGYSFSFPHLQHKYNEWILDYRAGLNLGYKF